MKPALIFQQYIWLINIFRCHGRMTLEELNERWVREEVAEGNPLSRTTFNRHRDAILDMFGVIIDCDAKSGYKYYIANSDVLLDDSLERWMLSTMTVGGVLSDSVSLKDRIILEIVPAGEEFLQTIIRAIKSGKKILMTYQRFGADPYEKVVSPYALKLFHQRWYLLVFTGRHYAIYSLDRMRSVSLTDEDFNMPADFSPQQYFAEYFGVLTDETPMAHVVIRTYGKTPNYFRTLPLHQSQQEIATTDEYTDFSFDIRPTADFIGQLLSHGDGLEVLEPLELRQQLQQQVEAMLQRYKQC
ncbi:MAG: WYL domain-containing protein [Prevotella sp.]|nr:WYL domain-containing protein [Prevotella sp.]